MIKDLIKFATHLDSIGLVKEASTVDAMIMKLSQHKDGSFDQPLEAREFAMHINSKSESKGGFGRYENPINLFKFLEAYEGQDGVIICTYENRGSGSEGQKLNQLEGMFTGITTDGIENPYPKHANIVKARVYARGEVLEIKIKKSLF